MQGLGQVVSSCWVCTPRSFPKVHHLALAQQQQVVEDVKHLHSWWLVSNL